MFKNLFQNKILTIIIFAVIVRLIYLLIFADLRIENYFEYGDILKNLLSGKGYSLAYQIDGFAYAYPSAYMPPGYVFFLLPFMFFKEILVRNILIFLFQILLSASTVYLVYKFTEKYFSRSSGLIAAGLTSILPEFIYAANTIGSTIVYHVGIILILLYLYRIELLRAKDYFLLGGIFGTLIYFRSEFVLYLLIFTITAIAARKIKPALITIFTVIVLLLPWQIRNYAVFDSYVPLSTSGGLNFYRGHNPYSIGDWGDESVFNELKKHIGRNDYEIEMNRIYFDRGMETIRNQPGREFLLSFEKIFHLWIINPSDVRTKNLFYFLPSLFILLFAVLDVIKTHSWQKHKYSYLFFIYSTLIAVIFFALPRYQTMMKIVLIPFASFGIEWFLNSIRKKDA